ncbi:MAG: hypothetical protein ACR2MS_00335 [Weeksellaceae bacterium]
MKKQIFLLGALSLSLFTLTSCGSDDDSGCVEKTWYQDADGDGLGNKDVSMKACNKPDGYVSNADDDNDTPDNSNGVVEVTENISSDTTWTNDNIYVLSTRVTVLDGVTLTIEPGTIIKGEAGSGANATALVVARGGKLMAEGTADKPIIFTSIADKLQVGEKVSSNMAADINGLWGGVIVLGKAPISAKADAKEIQIEGIPSSDTNGLYGGSEANDDSGVIKYVSIRHGGTNIGEGNEINGLTLGGVGAGTVIENIEVVANQDDGIEFFGGTVNVKNVTVWNNGDDAIDTDQNWTGTLDGLLVVKPNDNAFELDGPEGSATPTAHTIKNGYVVAGGGNVFNFDDNSAAHISNVKVKVNDDSKGITNRVAATKGDVTFTDVLVDKISGENPAGIAEGDITGFDMAPFAWTWTAGADELK